MDSFKVDEICIGQNFIAYPEHNGMECVVIGELTMRPVICKHSGKPTCIVAYKVRWANGDITAQEHRHLRRKYANDINKLVEKNHA
jgi:hypothetical protein